MKIGVICSPGGHLTQALAVSEAFKEHDVFLVIQDFKNVKTFNPAQFRKTYHLRILFEYSLGVKINASDYVWFGVYITLFLNFFELLKIFFKEKPDIVFSTGAEIAIPAFYIGKFLFGTKLIFLDSITRIKELSFTAKVLMPITDLFLVQWGPLAKKYGKAKFLGKVI